MSDVTAPEVIGAVARAYGFAVDQVKHNGPSPKDDAERRRRLQARIVAAYLLHRHRGDNRAEICRSLGLPVNSASYELIDLARGMVGSYRGYDADLGYRIEKAELRIDDIHERRMQISYLNSFANERATA